MASNVILRRFFSKNVFGDISRGNSNDVFDCVVRRYIDDVDGKTYGELISEVYAIIGKKYRTEYFYKNTLLNKLLIGRHDYRKTTVLTELPIAESKADFVMINGKGVVYEIKTELDNLDRLKNQVSDYYKAFTYVNIVTYENNVQKVLRLINDAVGIIVLTKRGALKTVRNAKEVLDYLDYASIFNMLRKHEFEAIMSDNSIPIPNVSQFFYYEECLKQIKKLDIAVFQKAAMNEIKNRTKIETVEYALGMPLELRFLAYFSKGIKKTQIDSDFLNDTYGG